MSPTLHDRRLTIFPSFNDTPSKLSIIAGFTIRPSWPNLYRYDIVWHHVNARILTCKLWRNHDTNECDRQPQAR